MDANTFQLAVARTLLSKPDASYSDEDIMLVWNAIGLAGESGEVCDYIKKLVFHQHSIDVNTLIKELGDVLWYVTAICSNINVSLSDVMQANIDKLLKRYPNGYNPIDSKKRVDV